MREALVELRTAAALMAGSIKTISALRGQGIFSVSFTVSLAQRTGPGASDDQLKCAASVNALMTERKRENGSLRAEGKYMLEQDSLQLEETNQVKNPEPWNVIPTGYKGGERREDKASFELSRQVLFCSRMDLLRVKQKLYNKGGW